ncbi:alpha/beta fold hydrolase [Roseibium aggregatum]|uniref:Alpha/beta fold hydrolase n=1 Tax=Roseibium aggregatum TaxID=187304 RepID=A0A926P3H8_9HYPH|nr:alpha/beta fold hydrolase [Roseibium aggregatum]MBD1548958.1 alpha/beta fold hydrolase [Roseibium aggregatum]
MPRSAALPVSLGEDFALYHAASGSTGYVFCGAWGYDELCSRKFLRRLAEDLADAGFPVLRADYPGTVNMRDPVPDTGLEGWIGTAVDAADRLKELSGCSRILYLGLGIGSAIAFLAAQRRKDVDGVVLAGPVASGRRYMREVQLHANVTNEGLGLALQGIHGDTGFSGFAMSEKLQADLKTINLDKLDLSTRPRCLVLTREGNENDNAFAGSLAEKGLKVQCETFEGYFALMAAPTTSVVPPKAIADIVSWSKTNFASASDADRPGVAASPQTVIVKGDGFVEQPVTFGPNGQFFGVLCRPETGDSTGATAVFLNTGYGHHIGWGRIWVRAARELARKGITSLRFDMANIGDSPQTDGLPDQVIYTKEAFNDVSVALDFLEREAPGPVFLVGRCSGAYVAFNEAVLDARVKGVMLINQLRLIWDPGEDVEAALRSGARPLDEYRRRAMRLETVKRVLTGKVDLIRAGGHIFSHVSDRLSRKLAPYLGPLTKLGRFRRACFSNFDAMARRGIPVHVVNCENDGSLDELARYFGADFSGLKAYPNVVQTIVPNADHNLTPEDAQQHLLSLLDQALLNARWNDGQAVRSQAAE